MWDRLAAQSRPGWLVWRWRETEVEGGEREEKRVRGQKKKEMSNKKKSRQRETKLKKTHLCLDKLPAVVGPPVDPRGQRRQPRDQVQRVLQHGLPVPRLVQAVGVRLGELGPGLHRERADGELRHRVRRARRQGVHRGRDLRREGGAGLELCREGHGLGLGRDLRGNFRVFFRKSRSRF